MNGVPVRAGNELYNRDESGGRKPLGFGKCVPKRERHELAGLFEGFVARVLVLNTLSMHNMFLCKTIVLARTKGKLFLKSCIQIARRGHTASVLALGEKKKKKATENAPPFSGYRSRAFTEQKKSVSCTECFCNWKTKTAGLAAVYIMTRVHGRLILKKGDRAFLFSVSCSHVHGDHSHPILITSSGAIG